MKTKDSGLVVRIGLPIALFMLLYTCQSAAAQDADEADAETSESVRIDEIYVTGTRRSQSLSKVPLAMSAVGQAKIEDFGYTDMESYFRSVPAVSLLDGGAQQKQFILRGVSAQATTEAKAATGIYLDEILVSANFSNLDPRIFDMERVEILRGPQGTLFGGGSIAGSVRYITNAPNPNEFEANFAIDTSSTKGADAAYGLDGMVNIPLIEDTLALRMVGFYADSPGFYKNSQFNEDGQASYDQSGGRVSILWNAADNFSITGMYARDISDQEGWTRAAGADWQSLDQTNRIPEVLSADAEVLALTAEWDVGWASIKSVTSDLSIESDYITDFSFFGFDELWEPLRFGAQGEFDDSSFTQELRMVSDPGSFGDFGWIVGIYYADRENTENFRDCFSVDDTGSASLAVNYENAAARFVEAVPDQDLVSPFPANYVDPFATGTAFGAQPSVAAGAFPNCLYRELEVKPSEELAFYGELSYDLSDRVTGTVGYRRTEGSNSSLLVAQYADFGPAVSNEVVDTQKVEETHNNFMLNLSMDVSDTTTVYARAADGFRMGSAAGGADFSPSCEEAVVNQLGSIPGGVESDSLVGYEIGYRYQSPDGGFRFNAGAFHNDWSDIQVEVIIEAFTDDCSLFAALNQNAGNASGNGLEFDMAWLASERLEFTVSGSYIDFTLDEDIPFLNGFKGNRLPSHPDLSLYGSADYRFPLGQGWTGFVRGELSYTGEILGNFVADLDTSRPMAGDYLLANTRTGISFDRWEVSLYVDNLFDKSATNFQFVDFDGQTESLVVRPRTVGMTLRSRF
ncbi:MAG: iron complex outermembrane receptor protein [Candidatus Azotimanducaceae bacterium]|jgi:outer membrane receptor protein involved in Fe transport